MKEKWSLEDDLVRRNAINTNLMGAPGTASASIVVQDKSLFRLGK